ncbi:MAG: PAS domain S-box protein, partial [Proteobacteria bacterium]
TRCLKYRTPYDVEYRCVRPNGEIRHCHSQGKVILDAAGKVIKLVGSIQDITERTQAASALREREEQLQLVISVNNDGWCEWDPRINKFYFDPRFYTMAGYEPNEFPGEYVEWSKRVHPQDIEKTEKTFNEFLTGVIAKYDVEFRFKRKDGDWMWIRSRINIIGRDDNGAPVRLVGTHSDISERVRADEALRSREEQLRLVVAVNNDGWYDWDLVANAIYFDPRYYTMAGYDPDEFPAAYEEWVKRIHPDDLEKTEATSIAFVRGEISDFDEEFRFKRKNGEWMWIRSRTNIISRDDSGLPSRVVGTHTDITARKHTETELKDREEQLSLVMSVTNDGWYDWDMTANSFYFDPRCYEMAGYEPREFSGTHNEALKIVHPEDTVVVKQALEAFMDGTTLTFDMEYRHKRKNGTWMWVRSKIKTISRDEQGSPIRVIGTMTDIDEKKLAEINLTEAQRIAHLGFWELDVSSGESFWSDETYRIFRLSPDNPPPTIKDYYRKHIPQSEWETIDSKMAAHIDGTEPLHIEHTIIRANGDIGYVVIQPVRRSGPDADATKIFGTILDITERKLTEINLEAAQRISHLGFWEIDLNSRQLSWSKETYRIFKLPADGPAPLLDAYYEKYIPEYEWDKIKANVDAHINNNVPFNMDYSIIRATGEIGYLRVQAEVIRDAEGQPTKLFGTALDITESKLAELDLKEAQRITHLGFWTLDLDSRELTWSEENLRIYRLPIDSPTPSVKEYFRNHIPDSEWAMINAKVESHLNGTEPLNIEYPIIRANGEMGYVRVQSDYDRDKNRKSNIFFGTTLDITESKLAELDLKEAQRIAHLGFWNLNVTTNELTVSDEVLRIFGFAPDDNIILTADDFFEKFIPSDDKVIVRSSLDVTLNQGKPIDLEYRVIRVTGEIRNVHARGEVFHDNEGDPIRVFGTLVDITDKKRIDEELAQHRYYLEELVEERTNELEVTHQKLVRKEKLATLGQLAASVSHELRNPLGTIGASLYTIAKTAEKNGLDLGAALPRAERNLTRCDKIIDGMLDYTRVQELELTDIDIDDWCAYVLDEYSVPENISVARELHCETTTAVEPERLHRAVINILNNACQAMSDNGQCMEDNRLLIRTVEKNARIEIQIIDTGPGIDDADFPKIFDPLYSSKTYGVGLGLSIVKQIMEQHDGGIDIASNDGRGTCVTLWLPINEVSMRAVK